MTLAQLIARFRTDANDKLEPYFWSDEEVIAWLVEAEEEAALRASLLHESTDAAICRIDVVTGQSIYSLHPAVIEIDYIAFLPLGRNRPFELTLRSREVNDAQFPGWREQQALPKCAIHDDGTVRLVPVPDRDGTLILEVYRLPLAALADLADTPEIQRAHHVQLVAWALHRGFSIPDTEFFDPQRASNAEAEFTRYFGIRPDADRRRSTRQDAPHHTEAFWA